MKFIKAQDAHRLDKAINFLVKNYSQTGNNPKPVIFHSLSVAFYLLNYNYDLDLIEAAVLHDLIEDSNVTKNDLVLSFGNKIADWVEALSFQVSIVDPEEQYQEMFNRVKLAGREVLIIKCADIYSNSFYIKELTNIKKQKFLVTKLNYFLEFSKELIGEEPVWLDLFQQNLIEAERLSSSK